MSAFNLPDSWMETELSRVADVSSGIGFPLQYQGQSKGEIGFFKVGDISIAVKNNDGILESAQHYVSTDVAQILKGKPIKTGATVFAKIGEAIHLNRRAIVKTDCLVDNNVMSVKAKLNVMDKYVHYFLRTTDFSEQARSTTVPSIRKGDVEELQFPLAPLPEQKRIADKLDTVLARVDACRERLNRVPLILKRFKLSVLAAATSGKLTEDWRNNLTENSKDWMSVRLSQIGELGRGKSKHRPRNDPKLFGGDYPFIQTGDITNSGGLITEHTQTYSDFGLAQSKLWPAKTLCITIAANIADTAILLYPACFPDSIVGFAADQSKCVTKYIKWTIDVIKTDLETYAPATAQKNINLSILNEIEFPLAPLDEQQEIVRRVETLFAFADRLEARLTTARNATERLTPALLAKAFRGELVPQDPNDEPASALLARLSASANDKAGKAKGAGSKTKAPAGKSQVGKVGKNA